MVGERWCVTKWCVKDGVSKMVGDKEVCEGWCVEDGGCHQLPHLPHLPRKTKVDVTKCHTCNAKRRWMSPSATPATQNEGGCHQVPHLPRETKVDVTKGDACHAKWRGAPTKRDTKCNKCRGCHVKRRWMSPSATPAMQNEGGCLQVPRLPRKTKVDVTKCHAWHAKWRGAPGNQARHQVQQVPHLPPATPNAGKCLEVLRLPRETKMDVTKCHACHAKRRCVTDGVSKMVSKMVGDKVVCERWCVKGGG